MKKLDPRAGSIVAVAAAAALLAFGCSLEPEVSETLDISGNHSTGDLVMVTADTSSDGYQYLEPDLSPDGTRLVFTIDWLAITPPGQPPDVPPLIRQLAVMPLQVQDEPKLNLRQQGAALVLMNTYRMLIGAALQPMQPNRDNQKGTPRWINDDDIVFWLETPRGARLFQTRIPPNFVHGQDLDITMLLREPDDDLVLGWKYWEQMSPSVSPNGRWIAFSRYGHTDADSLHQATDQAIWVCAVPESGQLSQLAFPVTSEVSICDSPSWSPDGSKIVFSATLDIQNSNDFTTRELFTVDFDTTGLAAEGGVVLDRGLTRLTTSPPPSGSNFIVRNMEPSYSPDGGSIIFVSDRRVPTITLNERNIWRIPADGSLEPRLLFFTRSDDQGAFYTGRTPDEILLTSGVGFPTEMLDALWSAAYDSIAAANPDFTAIQVETLADQQREQLEFFEDVMTHIYLFSNW
ncbi:MAG: PD40 domain-containing protein [bacterium]|nr:PD40 domain-containing protein [bacterium]